MVYNVNILYISEFGSNIFLGLYFFCVLLMDLNIFCKLSIKLVEYFQLAENWGQQLHWQQ